MTAKISPTTNMGTSNPVDCRAPRASARIVTESTAVPFIPALESPWIKIAERASNQVARVRSEKSRSVVIGCIKTAKVSQKIIYLALTKTKLCSSVPSTMP